jgi:hypothetical protein
MQTHRKREHMDHSDQAQPKRAWRAPEMIDVGGVLDLTEGMSTNVRDNHDKPHDPVSWSEDGSRIAPGANDEVDLA